jgi:hypothetical protein
MARVVTLESAKADVGATYIKRVSLPTVVAWVRRKTNRSLPIIDRHFSVCVRLLKDGWVVRAS